MLLNTHSPTSHLPECLLALHLAASLKSSHGVTGIRCPAGMNMWGPLNPVKTANLVTASKLALSLGLELSILLNMDGKIPGEPVPTVPLSDSGIAWHSVAWQKVIHDVQGTGVRNSWELANEIGRKGNRQPIDRDGTWTTFKGLHLGDIPGRSLNVLNWIQEPVDFGGVPVICLNTASDETVDPINHLKAADNEVNSLVGPDYTAIATRHKIQGFNCYSKHPATPYSPTAEQAAYKAKVQRQLSRFAANPNVPLKIVNRECGCSVTTAGTVEPNLVRRDVIIALRSLGIEPALFTAFNDPEFAAWVADAGFTKYTALGGVSIF